mgnify:CR=1 FL=1
MLRFKRTYRHGNTAASIAYQITITIITYKENKRIHLQYQTHHCLNPIQPGQFLVIFSAYTQIISVVANVDENTISLLLTATDVVGNPYTQIMFSLQCLYLLRIPDLFKGLQFQVLLHVFSPLIKISIVMLFEFLRNLIWKDPAGLGKQKSLVRIGAVTVVLILLQQPGIIGVLCKYLTCWQLDPFVNRHYIKAFNSIQCHTERYNLFKSTVVVPALTFWALLIPSGIFVILYKMRRKLFVSESLRIIFGNFYNSYDERSYYWGVVYDVHTQLSDQYFTDDQRSYFHDDCALILLISQEKVSLYL